MTDTATKPKKGRLYVAIASIILVAQVLLLALTTFITYPTDTHRATQRTIDTLQQDINDMQDRTGSSPEYAQQQELYNSAEGRYSANANMIIWFVTLAANIGMISGLYVYLRKKHITRKAHGVTVLLFLAGYVLPFVFGDYLINLYLGSAASTPFALSVIGTVFGLIFVFAGTVLVTFYVQSFYNKRHGFVIE